ncbi:hypothetical protein GH714_000927 [Hevea brasiliensis]|uniref:Uncharacterized protein n=1 Tax=Hevea brasiliensis TaxID=3981 RepID=A0A6A6N9Z6_HEVBR|nr:hypothetical protein GH714_000927 [Hevea brasiliensis]
MDRELAKASLENTHKTERKRKISKSKRQHRSGNDEEDVLTRDEKDGTDQLPKSKRQRLGGYASNEDADKPQFLPSEEINPSDTVSPFSLNCVAFEQGYNREQCSSHFKSYVTFIGCLINTAADAGYLRDRQIIENYFGTDEERREKPKKTTNNTPVDSKKNEIMRVFKDLFVDQQRHEIKVLKTPSCCRWRKPGKSGKDFRIRSFSELFDKGSPDWDYPEAILNTHNKSAYDPDVATDTNSEVTTP